MSALGTVGPAQLLEALGQTGPLSRYRATVDGERVEVLVLDADADPATLARFETTHALLATASHPALLTTRWTGTTDTGASAAIRQWTTPLALPTAATQAASVLRAIEPAVRVAGPALLSHTTPRDLRETQDGAPVVAPWGISVPGDTGFTAPEHLEGAPHSALSALYGLGASLYSGLTGTEPLPPGVRPGEQAPALASSKRTDLPYNIVHALDALLATDPERRRSAVTALDVAAPPATAVTGTVKTTANVRRDAPARNARVDVRPERAAALVTVPAKELANLSPSERSRVAGWAGVPVSVVQEAARAGTALVVDATATASSGRARLADLQNDAPLGLEVLSAPSLLPLLPLLAVASLGVFVGGVALLIGAYWLLLFTLLFFALGLAGSVYQVSRFATFRSVAALRSAYPQARATSSVLREAWAQSAAVRRRLSGLELPAAAESDLRDALTEIESHLTDAARLDSALAKDDPARAGLDTQILSLQSALSTLEAPLPTQPGLPSEPVLGGMHDAVLAARRALASETR